MQVPIPNLHECPICQARSDQIENHDTYWFCNGCGCNLHINTQGRIVRKPPAQHLYTESSVMDTQGNVSSDP